MEKLCKKRTNLEEFEKAISSNQVDVNEKFGHEQSTALMWAAEEGYDKIVSLLIEKGANMDLQNKYGNKILLHKMMNAYR